MPASRLALTAALAPTFALPAFAQVDYWDMLSQIEIDEQVTETSYHVEKTYPQGLQNDVEGAKITGYAVPLWAGDEVREFMLVTDMGNCPFCGSGDHGGNLMVELETPVTTFEEGARMTLEGTLARVLDPETWQAAVLKDAKIITQ